MQWSQQKKQSDPSREPIPGSLTNITYQNKINKNSTHLDHSPAHLAQANWNFVEKLLKVSIPWLNIPGLNWFNQKFLIVIRIAS